ncbi:signal peptidase I [Dictyobacter kobayashii]|uniref:Signal peptidase I n=1 Tax=Dictyobacter kobayashii TaxID=2014872 RepID=A0A402AJU6_9CHLR|nr:signal peptidase I [Dictyobacter kobayashii]GCE19353.1 signal peptidase I [Dictyobacter kobayashii]
MKRSQLIREIVEILALTLLIFLVVRFVVQSYRVDGPSMEPGLVNNEFVMVNKVSYLFHEPARGDVIVFHWPRDTTKDFIKRIIGLPGDTITTDREHVTVNGKVLNEPYISAPDNPEGRTWKVPPGQYFVMGDNRPVSDDSRSWGFVPKDYIVGKASVVFWPLSNLHFINTYPDVFKDIPTQK